MERKKQDALFFPRVWLPSCLLCYDLPPLRTAVY